MAMIIMTKNSYSSFKAEMFLVYLFSDIVIISYAPIENKPQKKFSLKKQTIKYTFNGNCSCFINNTSFTNSDFTYVMFIIPHFKPKNKN